MVLVAALLVIVALFDIDIRPEFSLPGEQQVADPEQEQRFDACYARRDKLIHQQAFGTIDNPDVQREFISMHRDTARKACREQYPEQLNTIRTPLKINLLDLSFRFGR